MIVSYLLAARAFLAKVPWQVWAVLGIILTAWLWGNHRYHQGYAASEAKNAAIVAKALTQARNADSAAHDTVNAGNDAVRASNDKARKAAEGSDDPLKASMDSLRGKK